MAAEGSPSHQAQQAGHSDIEPQLAQMFAPLDKIGSGSFGIVFRAVCQRSGERVAIKKIPICCEDDGVPSTALREVASLKDCAHPNVINLRQVTHTPSSLYLVFDCFDMDLRAYVKLFGALRGSLLKSGASQLFQGLKFCHGRRILHRDLKPQNVLVDVNTMRLVLADFGLARPFTVPLKVYTHEVVTLWYRPPEILLGAKKYGPPMDIWSLGCVFAEMATGQALFPGDSEIDTVYKIFQKLGSPNDEVWPGVTNLKHFSSRFPRWKDTELEEVRQKSKGSLGDAGMILLRSCLRYNTAHRVSAARGLRHEFFEG